MRLTLLLEMAASGTPERVAVQDGQLSLSYADLDRAARGGAALAAGSTHLVYVGTSSVAFPVAMFAAAVAGVPFVPLNYRLTDEQLTDILSQHDGSYLVADAACSDRLLAAGHAPVERTLFLEKAMADGPEAPSVEDDAESPALLLYTSGTTAAPKAAILRHRHLVSYIIGSVDFGAADESDAALVSVPPYHIAGVANLLSNIYLGRRVVYLEQFDPATWLEMVKAEGITHAMVVPTMLARVCEHLSSSERADVPALRSLSYGGARMPSTVLMRALELFPDVDFVNAYGLTETSSTIAVLGPDDHRDAVMSDDPVVRARLSSAGRLLPGIEVDVRSDDGRPLPAGETGGIFVRGEQVSGEYVGRPPSVDGDGWFDTRDRGWVDSDGYLFIEGRSDDTIIRGGENIAPAEIEDVLLAHPAVEQCAVVGLPDEEWGQRIVAVVVPRGDAEVDTERLRDWARQSLRGSKTPERIVLRAELPQTDTGKLLRRVVLAELLEIERAETLT